MQKNFSTMFKGAVSIFAIIGLVFTCVFLGMQFGIFNVRGSIAERNLFFHGTSTPTAQIDTPCSDITKTVCQWNETREWEVVKGGLTKDKEIITRVSNETGVPARLLAATVVPEQTRFFTAEREIFKKYFEPLKILGSLSQFSLGVSGIKQDTATNIEQYSQDTTSPLYPGASIAPLIAYNDPSNRDSVLYQRLTNAKDHYYSYLYTAIFIKEIESQWQKAGFSIDQHPDVIITLFNLGFQKSIPNTDPKVGGALITTGGNAYPYGELGGLFYNSDELIDIFPRS